METVLWETRRRSCLPGMGSAGSHQQREARRDGWAPAAGQAACPATGSRDRDGTRQEHVLVPAGTSLASSRASLGVPFPMDSLKTVAVLLLERWHFGWI